MADFPILDVHFHLWDLDKYGQHYKWLQDIPADAKLAPLKKSYLYPQMLQDHAGCNVLKAVHVQGEFRGDEVQETRWLNALADANPDHGFPHAIVGFVDLSSDDAEAVIEDHMKSPRFVGVRQLLNWHDDDVSLRVAERDYLTDPKWRAKMALLQQHHLLFEFHIYQHQMPAAASLADEFPHMPFVLDHLGCPYRRDDAGFADWCKNIQLLATKPNVYCKISGLIHPQFTTRGQWSIETLRKWVKAAVETFGVGRCMYGSNFPVDGVCGGYKEILDTVKAIFTDMGLDQTAQRSIFYGNAAKLYLQEDDS